MTTIQAARPNPAIYISVVLVLTLLASWFELRVRNIFACQASATADDFLAYCDAPHYGDYDHGAFWYSLEPAIGPYLRKAQVLFMGNSRMQWAFSGANTTSWFASAHASYYLLGFAYSENYVFEGDLLRKFGAQPKAYVIDLDGFFLPSPSDPARMVMAGGDTLRHYQDKMFRQRVQEFVCSRLRGLCGHRFAFFRSRLTGQWARSGGSFPAVPASEDGAVDEALVTQQTAGGTEFLAPLPIAQECVVLTMVPSVSTRYAEAAAIAERLHLPLVAPRLEGLRTFDGSHLDSASAERWSRAFYEQAGPLIERCLGRTTSPAAASAAPPVRSRLYADTGAAR
jgi:hypothetical protein